MSRVFVIGELACTWLHGGLEAAFRGIRAIKECGADAAKFQWTSDPEAMAMRRGVARDKYTRLGWAQDALPKLKEECERVGVEFLCTVFIEKDVRIIKDYVKWIKVSAFESTDAGMVWEVARTGLPSIVSVREGVPRKSFGPDTNYLHVVSEYPTPLDRLNLRARRQYDGLSDHTTSTLTGAVAVGAGARIIEKHVRLSDTPSSDPDYGHSLVLMECAGVYNPFKEYVDNIREAERML
jgi:sialic acid synthase SpsE